MDSEDENPNPLQLTQEQQMQWQQQQQALYQQQLYEEQQWQAAFNAMTPEVFISIYQKSNNTPTINTSAETGYFPVYVQVPEDNTAYWQFYLNQTNKDPKNTFKAPIMKKSNDFCNALKDTICKQCGDFFIFLFPLLIVALVIVSIIAVSTIIIAAVILYIIYLCCVYQNMTNTQIKNYSSEIGVNNFLDDVKQQAPRLVHKMECYHFETRTSGSGENRRTERVKVTSKRAVKTQVVYWWADGSKANIESSEYQLMRFYFFKQYTFEDLKSAEIFASTKSVFIKTWMDFDLQWAYTFEYDINHFRDSGLFTMDSSLKTIWTNYTLFNCMSLLLCSCCFAFGLNKTSGSQDYQFVKRIKLYQQDYLDVA